MLNSWKKKLSIHFEWKKWSHVPRKIDLKEMKTIHGSESTIWSYLTYSLEKNELSSNKENTQKISATFPCFLLQFQFKNKQKIDLLHAVTRNLLQF